MKALPKQASVLDSVYSAIRDSICDGGLMPGGRLTQDDIAEMLGVSRQPVGQALILLKSQGFVSDAGRRGVVVAPLRTETVREIYELRGALDELAARLAARRARQAVLARGYEILEDGQRLVAVADVQGLLKADMAFHGFIYEASQNPLIQEALASHWHQLRRVMSGVIEQDNYRAVLWSEHEAILGAISEGDEERAAQLSRRHVEAACEALCSKLDARLELEAPAARSGTAGR
jgi:DNA-binding GntR family transcriptional regulator